MKGLFLTYVCARETLLSRAVSQAPSGSDAGVMQSQETFQTQSKTEQMAGRRDGGDKRQQ